MKNLKPISGSKFMEKDDGFTMLEILVAIIIVSVLTAISIATFNGFRKDAINATLISDVRNAGVKIQGIIILSKNPLTVPQDTSFFRSDESNTLLIKTITNSVGAYCVIGKNSTYEDLTIYYSSEMGGITQDGTVCGEGNVPTPEPVKTTLEPEPTTPPVIVPEPTVEPTPEPTQPVVSPEPEPTPVETVTPEPTIPPIVIPTPEPTEPEYYPEYGEGMASIIPTSSMKIIELDVPSDTCKILINEKIQAKINLYSKVKEQNLVSIMARLQSGKTLEDIMKNTSEAKRIIEINRSISKNKSCSEYIANKDKVVKYYEKAYNEEQEMYNEFLRNLDENSANEKGYVNAYKKLYERVYKTI